MEGLNVRRLNHNVYTDIDMAFSSSPFFTSPLSSGTLTSARQTAGWMLYVFLFLLSFPHSLPLSFGASLFTGDVIDAEINMLL